MTSIQQRVGFDTERTLSSTVFDGTFRTIGSPITFNPVIMIIDNQTDVDVPLSVDGVNIWRTFPAGEAIIFDFRTNKGLAPDYTIDLGTQFSTNATTGTSGNISISLLYAR